MSQQKTKSSNGCYIALGVAGGVAILLLVLAVMAWSWMTAVMEGPTDVVVTVDAPLTATIGQSFEIRVVIENTATETQSLNSIDLYDSYLEGIEITSTEPPFDEASSLFGFTSYYYETDIPAGQTIEVVLTAMPLRAGDFRGDLDVCINTEYTFVTHVVRTSVDAASSSPTPPANP